MKKLMVVFVFLIASLSGFARSSMAHPPDQKLVKNTNAMMIDTMQAAQAVRNKHMPEIEAQIEKTAAGASQPALTQPK
jgi:hypothetical protein